MDPRLLGDLQSFPSPVDVFLVTASQSADGGAADVFGDSLHRFKVTRRGDRETGFDDVDAQIDQSLGNLQLLVQVHACARRLFAVAKVVSKIRINRRSDMFEFPSGNGKAWQVS